MRSQSMAGALLALLSMVSAQTNTVCDPTKKECPPNPAFAGTIDIDYTKGKSDFFNELPATKITYDKSKGAVFTIGTEKDAPTIESPEFIFFGKLEVELAVAPGAGIVTSIVLQSLTLDEIDWEWLGGFPDAVQTNYFSKGDTTTYDRGGTHGVANSFDFHTYAIDWTKESLTWSVDGNPVRVLTYQDAKGGKEYPQTPMQVKLGSWVAGRSDAAQGTVDWAGGMANFDNGPTHAYYRRVSVTDYAGGEKGAKQYIYSDKTGTWESIYIDTEGDGVVDKEAQGDDDEETPTPSSSSVKKTTTLSTVTTTGSSTGTATVKPTASSTDTEDAEETGAEETDADETDADETDADETDAGDTEAGDAPAQTNTPDSGSVSAQAFTLAGAALSGFAFIANL